MNTASVQFTGARPRNSAPMRDGVLLVVVVALVGLAALGARVAPWTPGSDPGYWLGVAGGVALLGLFLYPLRKRWRRAHRWGDSRGWFAAHMTLGIAAPLLVVLHSRLEFGSLNATIAFACMALVAASGVVGRFIDRDEVVAAHGHEEGLEFAAHGAERLFGRIESRRRVLGFRRPLSRPVRQHDVGRHDASPSPDAWFGSARAAAGWSPRRSSERRWRRAFSMKR